LRLRAEAQRDGRIEFADHAMGPFAGSGPELLGKLPAGPLNYGFCPLRRARSRFWRTLTSSGLISNAFWKWDDGFVISSAACQHSAQVVVGFRVIRLVSSAFR